MLKQQSQQLQPLPDPLPVTYADLPLLTDTYMPHISALGAFVMDDTSRVVLYAKNENIRLSPASTTKIMTTLVALDTYKASDVLTVKRTGIEPVVVGFPLGAHVTFQDALYGLLLPSGNDVAYMLADNYPGGFSAFIAAMNAKAKLLHLDNTHYADPAGLVDDDDYTTPKDLAMLASYAIKHPVLAQVVNTKEKIIHDSLGNTYDVKNLNELLGKYGVNGIKTGYTGEAGEVLVTSSVMQGHTIIIVVMKSEDRFADTEKLLQLVQKNLTYLSVHP
ncbi:MAG TPA: hypothetical protein VN711_05230 [Candidatus Saccharimonadales bacterium]|nr:hypothetical protein [Candidatus Saccharimonadales bacterium]